MNTFAQFYKNNNNCKELLIATGISRDITRHVIANVKSYLIKVCLYKI